MDDEFDPIAAADQAAAATRHIALVVGAYYRNLVEQGVPGDLAAQLVLEYQHALYYRPARG